MNFFKRSLTKVGSELDSLVHRTTDSHVRLAVTGLSGAGKTAFITGLVNQLLHAGMQADKNPLPLWQVARDGRLIAVKRTLQPDLAIASFDYQSAMNALGSIPSQWPPSTKNITELRLAIKYRPEEGLLAKLTDVATLYVDIVDYPGEWLLDLPMLKQDFASWCVAQSDQMGRLTHSERFSQFNTELHQLDLTSPANESTLKRIADEYQDLLQDLVRKQGFYSAQPGRMLLPGEFIDTPLLAFFPLLGLSLEQHQQMQNLDKSSTYQVLKQRYDEYVSKVVKPFYRDHFAKFDRQVVLVDCLGALNHGQAQFNDMGFALNSILESFQFGQSSLLKRLFSPKIDKVLFVASQVDRVTRTQQGHLLNLLTALLKESQHFARFEGCTVETMAVSAIKVTEHKMVNTPEGTQEVLTGVDSQGQSQVIYPGDVPSQLPSASFWERQGFQFPKFLPPSPSSLLSDHDRQLKHYSHIRLDHLLEFLLGDKLS